MTTSNSPLPVTSPEICLGHTPFTVTLVKQVKIIRGYCPSQSCHFLFSFVFVYDPRTSCLIIFTFSSNFCPFSVQSNKSFVLSAKKILCFGILATTTPTVDLEISFHGKDQGMKRETRTIKDILGCGSYCKKWKKKSDYHKTEKFLYQFSGYVCTLAIFAFY